MAKHVSVDTTSAAVKDFFKNFDLERGEYVLELGGKPLVGIVPAWQVEKLSQNQEEVISLLDKSWEKNRTVTEDEISLVVNEAIAEVRRAKKQSRP